MNPDDCLDGMGGLMIERPKAHECTLPETRGPGSDQYAKLIAYKTGCCGTWYYPKMGEYDWYWEYIGKWRLKRMKKKGLIPVD